MEYQWNKCYSIGTNRTNGQIECTPIQPEADGNIPSPRNEMHFTNRINVTPLVPIIPMDKQNAPPHRLKPKDNEMHFHQQNTNGTIRTSGQVQCTPTQPEANGNILSPDNEIHFTSGIPME